MPRIKPTKDIKKALIPTTPKMIPPFPCDIIEIIEEEIMEKREIAAKITDITPLREWLLPENLKLSFFLFNSYSPLLLYISFIGKCLFILCYRIIDSVTNNKANSSNKASQSIHKQIIHIKYTNPKY